VIDVRDDFTRYLESHIPRAVYLHAEELRAAERGVPNKLLGLVSYTALFSRMGLRPDRPVVIYSAGRRAISTRTISAGSSRDWANRRCMCWTAGSEVGLENARSRALSGDRAYGVHARRVHAGPGDLDDVKASLTARDVVIVDARNPDQYAGRAGAQLRRGHIPGGQPFLAG